MFASVGYTFGFMDVLDAVDGPTLQKQSMISSLKPKTDGDRPKCIDFGDHGETRYLHETFVLILASILMVVWHEVGEVLSRW